MENPRSVKNVSLPRRFFLKGVGAAISLPLLNAMTPAFGRGRNAHRKSARRFIAMNAGLGFHTPALFPEKEGRGFALTPYLEELKSHVGEMTLFSGLSHPNQNGNNGHASQMTWLTSAQRPGLAGFKNTLSLDQLIAAQVGKHTRLPFLNLSNSGGSLSWTANGVNLPSMSSPAKLFKLLFVDGTAKEVDQEVKNLRSGKSVLDAVLQDANRLQKSVGPKDREKLDEYFSAIRDLEERLLQNESWARKPKPKVKYPQPTDVADRNDIVAKQRLMFDMIVLAIQTDSTRTISLELGGMNAVPSNIDGVKTDWHNLSHHGKDTKKIEELMLIEKAEFREFSRFLASLKNLRENDATLLDHTSVLFGSNLGNASSHSWKNLPIIVAGGGFRHGAYVAHDNKDNTPLANLFVALAQRMGVEVDRFGSSTAAGIRGLEQV